ncbi:MAG: 1-(5-phosphoribosyl)-5-[(5-phosphoribosylamino)methylideneamino]imidazole-4-carboxamide isomerase [Firmicutes bacterium]|nr:1-(5-phosphoribosyl)-5-[(5-phosphoribosylamino)methylideneamino]imidazole-4-carboxamide isomerase [Bacillota bacterium]
MLFIPAIDIRRSKAVRLFRGDYNQEKVYSEDPLELAQSFIRSGAKRIHVVDLDGAKGDGSNRKIIQKMAKVVSATIDTGGGIRNKADIEQLIESGVSRVVLGTVALENPELVKWANKKYPGRITVGIDAKKNIVKVKGWLEGESQNGFDLAREVVDIGIDEIIYTDIDRDGTLEGPNYSLYERLCKLPVKIVASGGVASLEDLLKLNKLPLYGVIAGKALYEKKFTVEEALEALT